MRVDGYYLPGLLRRRPGLSRNRGCGARGYSKHSRTGRSRPDDRSDDGGQIRVLNETKQDSCPSTSSHTRKHHFQRKGVPEVLRARRPRLGRRCVAIGGTRAGSPSNPSGVLPSTIRSRSQASATGLWTVRASFPIAVQVTVTYI